MANKNIPDKKKIKEIQKLFNDINDLLYESNSLLHFSEKYQAENGFRVGPDNYEEFLNAAEQRAIILGIFETATKELQAYIKKDFDTIEDILKNFKKDGAPSSIIDKIKDVIGMA